MNIRLVSDSNGDLPQWYLDQHHITILPMPYRVGGQDYRDVHDPNHPGYLDPKTFYAKLRSGTPASTSQITTHEFLEVFTPILAGGEDIFYVCFSSGLSGTCDSMLAAAEQLRGEFPERKIYAVDSLAAAGGEGLLTHIAAQKLEAGMPPAELVEWLDREKMMMHSWFTVDDLGHLRRGGRISAATAVMGTMLSIKPILDVNHEGKLISIDKVKGRKRSLKGLLERMEQYFGDPYAYDIFISHGDCEEDARSLADMIKARFGVEVKFINMLSCTVGTHSGPGTVALFFMGNQPRI